jgi:hypothetical protein
LHRARLEVMALTAGTSRSIRSYAQPIDSCSFAYAPEHRKDNPT